MHLDISIIMLTVILPYISIVMQQPDSYYSRSFSVFELAFQVYIPHIIPMSHKKQ